MGFSKTERQALSKLCNEQIRLAQKLKSNAITIKTRLHKEFKDTQKGEKDKRLRA